MKKMTSFMVMLLTAMVPVLFNSCNQPEPDDPNYAKLIVGEWDLTRLEWDVEYEGAEDIGSEYFDEEDWIWEFDGNKINMYMEGDDNDSYRYEIEDNKLYTEYATYYEAQYFKITTLNKNKLVLELTYRYEGVTAKYTFVFKRI